MARRLRKAAQGGDVPAHDSFVRMIHYWETGKRGTSERHELLYAAALGIEPSSYMTGCPPERRCGTPPTRVSSPPTP